MVKKALIIVEDGYHMVEDLRHVADHYGNVDLPRGPAIYSSADLYNAMFELGEFSGGLRSYRILDAMCGAGLVGKEISKRLTEAEKLHIIHYVDVAEKKLRELQSAGNHVVLASVDKIPYRRQSFDCVYSRFGVKNYPEPRQIEILNEFRYVLCSDGIFVLCDMESPPEAYEFMQAERREKHKYTGLEGSEPHLPTREMWFQMLERGGLKPRKVSITVSKVTTTDWVNSNQMSVDDLAKMNDFLLTAPEAARRVLNIRQEEGLVKIDYPVVVISASPA